MKIGVSSYSYQKYRLASGCSYAALCHMAKDTGFDTMEFIGLEGDPLAEADEIKETCEQIGLEVSAYTVGADFLTGDPADAVKNLYQAIEVARRLGAPLVRHDVGYRLPEGMDWQDAIRQIADPIRQVADYAADRGIRTCTENHGFVFQDSERMKFLMETVDHANYGWLVDIGNFLCVDEDPEMAVAKAVPYAVHVHAKDFLYRKAEQISPDGFFRSRGGNLLLGTVVGHGVVNVLRCVKTLYDGGYNGVLSLEFEGMEENLPAVQAGYHYLRAVQEAITGVKVGK